MSETKELVAGTATKTNAIRIEGNLATIDETKCRVAFGSTDTDFVSGIAGQLIQIGSQGPKPDEKGIPFVTSIIAGIQPKDPIESMLAAQMAAVHNATMTFARRLAHVDNIPQQDSASRAFNQLARTFAAQVEALKRHRNGGNQNVTVKHVHVYEGGQAIVGNVSTRGRGGDKNEH